MSDQVFVHGVALANYRGIGNEAVFIGPFGRFNFFVGANNSGKSAILNFIARHLEHHVTLDRFQRHGKTIPELLPLDYNFDRKGRPVRMGIGFPEKAIRKRLAERVTRPKYLSFLEGVLQGLCSRELLWLCRNEQRGIGLFEEPTAAVKRQLFGNVDHETLQGAWSMLTQRRGGSSDDWQNEILQAFTANDLTLPQVNLIPAIREISKKGEQFSDWSGRGLIEELARHQNPGFEERSKLLKFDRINEFLQAVTDNASAKIEIPFDREHVLVHMDQKVLPIEALGTGIHEVVMMAAFCTLAENEIICMEEPEIHLHPLLQRRLIGYLQSATTNQYFIATHSATIIDAPQASIFHVASVAGTTTVHAVTSSANRFDACRALGYRASDILQSNAIVWVEGPSDRIYLNHWIAAMDPDLVEGLHYSVMFYGGRLLSHLSASDNEGGDDDVAALIAVRQLNRNLCVLIDSDRSEPSDTINETKQRLYKELAAEGGIGWITDGREVENYIPTDVMTAALKACYSARFFKRSKQGKYDHVLPFKDFERKTVERIDKVKVALAVTEHPASLDVLDLRERMVELVSLIRTANR